MTDVLSEAITIIHKLSSKNGYYVNIDIRDIMLAKVSESTDWCGRKVDGFKVATIYLRNGLMIKADELDESLIIKSLNECHCE